MLSTSIKFPVAAGNSDPYNATELSFPARNERRGASLRTDMDPGTTNEVHPMAYAARQSIPAIPAIRIQEDMPTSNNGR